MAWTITNQQADPMTLTLANAAVVNLPGHGTAQVPSAVARIAYHGLNYARNGIWPFPDGQALNAFYPGQQNVHIQNPTTSVEAVYQHV